MICNATYDKFNDIPKAYRDDFENVNGKWQLKNDAIPGAAELLNPGLEANRNAIRGELVDEKQKVTDLTTKLNAAQTELNAARVPGGRVLSADDAKMFDSFTALGSFEDVKAKVDEHETLSQQVAQRELEGDVAKVASEAGLNAEVLSGWATHVDLGKGLKFFIKEVDVSVNGKAEKQKQAFVNVEEDDGNGKTKVAEFPILEVAKQRLPAYMQTALTVVDGNAAPTGQAAQPPVITGGVSLPPQSSAAGAGAGAGGDKKSPVEKFNAARESRPSPFAVSSEAKTN